jgi:hypothetical protein
LCCQLARCHHGLSSWLVILSSGGVNWVVIQVVIWVVN